jgi:glycerol-3-phosphate dehydrogenase (NAD(P)+)
MGIVGAGAFGTALALALSSRGREMHLYSDLPAVAQTINMLHLNPQFLPGIGLPLHCMGQDTLATAPDCKILFLSVPAQAIRSVCESLHRIPKTTPVIVCSKGIEASSGLCMGELAASLLPNPVLMLSGPSFAQEISRGLPTIVTLAGEENELLASLQESLETPAFRIEPCLDPIGVQVGGALKNMLAVGGGLVLGAGLGEDARAVLIARGFQEMQRIVQRLGGNPDTLLGMAGLGDVLLTCMSNTSRNTTFGIRVARREITVPLTPSAQGPLAEGALTAAGWPVFQKRIAPVETPILTAIHEALYANRSFAEVFAALLSHP